MGTDHVADVVFMYCFSPCNCAGALSVLVLCHVIWHVVPVARGYEITAHVVP